MNTSKYSEAEYVLRRALALADDELTAQHRWLWETERWHELVVALLTRVTARPEINVRVATDNLGDLGLLNVETLSELSQNGHAPDPNSPHARRIREVLIDSGLEPEEAQKGVATLCELAHGLNVHFQGKAQRYLRHYGELMLGELSRFFQFSALDQASVEYAFTFWLQNVLSMPLSLVDEDMRDLCEKHAIQPSDLMATADALDVNLALVDDVISRYVAMRKSAEKSTQSEQQEKALLQPA